MRKIIYTMALIVAISSCEKDDSTLLYPNDNPDFSKIEIKSDVEMLSVDFGDELNFTPEVTQSVSDKKLEYIWTASLKMGDDLLKRDTVFNEKNIKYSFKNRGHYDLRLEVKNEDYSVFKSWNVNVREHNEGIIVVGTNDNGHTNIAFARTLSELDILEGKKLQFVTDIVKKINPDYEIKDVVYTYKSKYTYSSDNSDAYFFIFTKTKIYILDHFTFKVLSVIDVPESTSGAEIKKVSIIDSSNPQASGFFTNDGRNMILDKKELLIYESEFLAGTYDQMYGNLFYRSGRNMNLGQVNIDKDESKIWTFINYHGSRSMINNTTGDDAPYDDNVKPNEYVGRNIVSVGRMNGDYWGQNNNINYFAVATDKTDKLDVKVVEFSTNPSSGFTTLRTLSYTSSQPITLSVGTELIANAKYHSMYYIKNGDIYSWDIPNAGNLKELPVKPEISLDGNKEATCMSISHDMQKLYVGFYDSDYSGNLKGGVYVYNCSDFGTVTNIQPIEKFEGISNRPVQVFYKTEGLGVFNPD
jgi:hypothetical protein